MSEIVLKTTKEFSEFEADRNLIGVFEILLAVDKRINPQDYKLKRKENNA